MITEKDAVNDYRYLSVPIKTEVRFDRRTGSLEYTLYAGTKDERDSYSIGVIQKRHGDEVCRALADDVTSSEETALDIFTKISSGLVSPITLNDVIYDLIP